MDVHHRVGIAALANFGDAVTAARMLRARHFHATEILRHFPDARVVRSDDDLRKRFRALALLNDVLDKRLARDERERLAGKARRSEARRDDADNFHATYLATDET